MNVARRRPFGLLGILENLTSKSNALKVFVVDNPFIVAQVEGGIENTFANKIRRTLLSGDRHEFKQGREINFHFHDYLGHVSLR